MKITYKNTPKEETSAVVVPGAVSRPLFESSQRNCPHLGLSIAARDQTEHGAIAEEEEQEEVEERRWGEGGGLLSTSPRAGFHSHNQYSH